MPIIGQEKRHILNVKNAEMNLRNKKCHQDGNVTYYSKTK
jgi:hypothetical protein